MDIDSEKPLDIRREPRTLAAVGTVPGTETLVGIMSSFEPLRAIPVAEFGCGVSGRVSGIGGRARMLGLADALWNRSNEVRQQLFYARRAGLLCRLRSLGELPCRSYCADLTWSHFERPRETTPTEHTRGTGHCVRACVRVLSLIHI